MTHGDQRPGPVNVISNVIRDVISACGRGLGAPQPRRAYARVARTREGALEDAAPATLRHAGEVRR